MRSFAEAKPQIPRKAASGALPRKAAPGAIPRKAGSNQKLTTRMSDKVAYPVFGTCGVIAGLAVYEVFRCRSALLLSA